MPFEIDEEDHELVSQYSWCLDSNGYPFTNVRHYTPKGSRWDGSNWYRYMTIRLHEFLLGKAPEGFDYDHIDRNKSNNRRKNIELVTSEVNGRNKFISIRNKSGYPGVQIKENGRYKVTLRQGKKMLCLGTYDTFEEAVSARRLAELKYWGYNYRV